MRLLLDDALPAELAQRLQLHNHDVVTVAARPDLRGSTDAELFAIAQHERRAVVTTNAIDFLELARRGEHCGVILADGRRLARDQALAQLARDLRRFAESPSSCASIVHVLGGH